MVKLDNPYIIAVYSYITELGANSCICIVLLFNIAYRSLATCPVVVINGVLREKSL